MRKIRKINSIKPNGYKNVKIIPSMSVALNTKKYSETHKQNYWVFLHIVIFGYNATLL